MSVMSLLVTIVLSWIASVQSTWALSESEIRSSIQGILKIRHPSETAEWWRALGPAAPAVIVSMYSSETNIYRRIRLLDALGWFDDSQGTQLLKREAQNSANHVIQNAALQALATSQGAREQEFFSKVMDNDAPEARVAVGKGLISSRDTQAHLLAEEMMKKEKESWVTAKLQAHRNRALLRKNTLLQRRGHSF